MVQSAHLHRECLDQVIIFGERQPRRILSAYAAYYNLQKAERLCIEQSDALAPLFAIPILAGLHHQYVRI